MKKGKYWIYDWIDQIRKRPWMYIGKHSITQLHIHLWWFLTWIEINGLYSFENPPFDLFHEWTAHKFWWYESTAWWANIILKESDNDESKALDNFFILLDEFRNLKINSIYKWKIKKNNRLFHFSSECKIKRMDSIVMKNMIPVYSNPKEVFIIEFDNFWYFYAIRTDSTVDLNIYWYKHSKVETYKKVEDLFWKDIVYIQESWDLMKLFSKIQRKRNIFSWISVITWK